MLTSAPPTGPFDVLYGGISLVEEAWTSLIEGSKDLMPEGDLTRTATWLETKRRKALDGFYWPPLSHREGNVCGLAAGLLQSSPGLREELMEEVNHVQKLQFK